MKSQYLLLLLLSNVLSFELNTNNDLGLDSTEPDGAIYPQYISDNRRVNNIQENDIFQLGHLTQGNPAYDPTFVTNTQDLMIGAAPPYCLLYIFRP